MGKLINLITINMSRAASHVFLAPCHLSLIGMFCLIQLFDYSEAAIWQDVCEPKDYGITRTEETYECRSDEILCTKSETTCSCSGMEMGWSGTDYYNIRGDRLNSVGGGGWDCAHKCCSMLEETSWVYEWSGKFLD